MRKSIFSLLTVALALGLSATAFATPRGQQRTAPMNVSPSPDLHRTASAADGRSAYLDGAVRKIGPAGQGFATPAPAIATRSEKAIAKAPMSRVSATLNVYGTVIYDNTWTNYDNVGLYKLPISEGGTFTSLFKTPYPIYSFYDGENKYYCMYEVAYGSWVMGYDLYVYDTETCARTSIIEFDDIALEATDVAYDPESGRAYGYFSGDYYGDKYRHWGYLDIQKKKVVKIADMDFSLRGVAIDKFGQAYGVGLDGTLYKIAKETGTFEVIGDTGCPTLTYNCSAAFNDKDGSILLSFCNDETAGLVEIDPSTAASEVLCTFENGAEVVGLYVPAQAPDKAPAAPGFEVSCTEGSMTADFTISMPTSLYDGTDATGEEMGYKVYANGTEILNGTATAGEVVEISATLAESGMYTFVAIATNDGGESNQTKASCYIGKGTPAAVKNVVLTYADGSFTLTWNAVTTSSDGGYIDAALVRYDIVDTEGNVVASDLESCTWSRAQETPNSITSFAFGVIAKYDAKAANAVMSNALYIGHYLAPLTMDMMQKTNFGQHTVIDANNDGKTWLCDSKGTYYKYGNLDADDWLISPAIYLEAGKAYDFNAIAHAYSDKYPETLEIKIGKSATVEGMTETLVEATTLYGSNTDMPGAIVPTESGEYYIGFHAITVKGQWNLYLVSYSISDPYGATAPAAVEGLTVTPDYNGDLLATVSFNAASLTVTGNAYEGNMTFKVLRNGENVKELTGAAGAELSFTDAVPEAGRYTYTIEAYNLDGDKGRSTSASSFVGPNIPNPPAVVKAVETAGKCGELTLSWEHAEDDVDGKPLNPANLTYLVYLYDSENKAWQKLTQQPISELSYTFTAQEETAPQTFVQVGVQTVNKGVEGDYLQGAGLVPVGPAYSLPLAMSKIEDVQQYIIGINNWDGCTFGMKADGEMSSVTSQDGDGQFFYGERVSSSATLGTGKGRGDFIFGKISLEGALHPVFSMFTWKITETDVTTLDLFVICDGEEKLVSTISYENDTHNQWTKKIISLDEYAGKSIQPIIRYTSNGLVYCFFDNIQIVDMPDYDLGAVAVTAPKTVAAGTDFDVNVLIENVGRLEATDFAVELTANGTVVDTKTVEALAADEKLTLVFTQNINMAGEKTVEYSARVVFEADSDLSNNVSPKSATVTREDSELPAVANLTGTSTEEGVVLTWDAINDDRIPYDPYTESFEDAEAFTKEYPGWTFIDRDGLPCASLSTIQVPNHQGGVDPESFIVIDGTHQNFALTSWAKEYVAADGKQYIGSLHALDENGNVTASDDWAISPLLKGCAQTVTFKGKNASINYSERIQVWYATTDATDPDEFVQLTTFNNPGTSYRVVRTDGWGEFSFELPEGALRFAIRVISNDGFMFMLDKVEYIAADAVKGLEHIGYNIYCNGTKLNDEPLADTSFTHSDVENGNAYTYHVSAVYNRGESEAEFVTVVPVTTGIGNIGGAAKVAVAQRQIIVSGAAGRTVAIFGTDGKMLHHGEGDACVSVGTGIYLVQIDNTTTKVIVR